jgi:methylglutaconyl-CoA hydratase
MQRHSLQERAMPNPIADPFVENVVSADLEALIDVRSDHRGVVTVVINGVGPSNALNGEVAGALKEAFETLHGADAARVVFLRGAGATFSSGADIGWLKAAAEDWDEGEMKADAMVFAEMMRALVRIPCPTVALVQGAAAGGGAGLVAACDMAIAASEATFGFPGVKTGGVPAVMAPYVVNAVGPRRAASLFMTGRTIDAWQAQGIGLVDEVVYASALGEAAEALAGELLENGPQTVHEAKRLAWDVWGHPRDGVMEETARRYARSRFSEEGREGLAATLERRKPRWAP